MAFDRKTFEVYYEKFAITAVIRVFNLIRTSAFLVERLFWIAVLLGGLIATIWSVTLTVNTFLSEPTASIVSYQTNTTSGLQFPQAIFCFDVSSESLLKRYEAQMDLAIIEVQNATEIVESLKKKLAKVHEREAERALLLTSATVNLTSSALAASQLDKYHRFDQSNFDIFSKSEVTLIALTTAIFVRLITIEEDQRRAGEKFLRAPESLRRLYQAYDSRGTNFSELFDLTAQSMCVLLQVRVVSFSFGLEYGEVPTYTPYNLCKRIRSPVYFGREI